MSVINQMLKDLESRQQHHQVSNLSHTSASVLPEKAPLSKWFWSILILLLLAGLGSGLYLMVELEKAKLTHTKLTSAKAADTEANASLTMPEASPLETSSPPLKSQATEELRTAERVNQPSSMIETLSVNAVATSPLGVADSTVDVVAEQVSTSDNQVDLQSMVRQQDSVKDTLAESVVSNDTSTINMVIDNPVNNSMITKADQAAMKQDKVNNGKMTVTPVKMSFLELAQKRYENGLTAEQSGNLEGAQSEFQRALDFNPELHVAREHLAAVMYGQGQLQQASKVLIEGIADYPDYQHYRLLLARVYQAGGQLQQAYDIAQKMQAMPRYAVEKWALMGDLAQQLNRFKQAEQAYDELLIVEPNSGRWLMAKAYAIDSQGRYQESAKIYRDALATRGLSESAVGFVEQRLQQLRAVE